MTNLQDKKIDKILITSITLSSGKILEKRFYENSKINHQFLPLDINSCSDSRVTIGGSIYMENFHGCLTGRPPEIGKISP